ncbi:Uncharacterized protein APZ42_021486 [Daphnia magna]|uniref:Uncharacterized protein n=1 Tax=Daphnia magna TaxID=35525 RepID=A0A164WM53_9CRUS|nr:Uncharacterized protein APZ42_021486 [Daphnia magna]
MFYEEDELVVEPVKGVKYNGTRYNSEKGFIYYFQKKTRHGDAYHNHPPEQEEHKLLRVVNASVNAAAVDCRRHRIVLDAARREYAGVHIGYGDAMQRRMQRSKRRRQPQIPKTIEEIVE